MKTFGIVVAAGAGERFGRPKALVELGGIPLWRRARDVLLAGGCASVVIVGNVPEGIPGGERRRDSVAAGLAVAPDDATHIVVHDAARPLASARLVELVIGRLTAGGVDAVVPAVPVRDTIKRVRHETVVETVDRADLVVVQTPQAFELNALRSAHAASDEDASDDALMIERAGGVVAVVPGEPENIKITFPGDLALAEAMLR